MFWLRQIEGGLKVPLQIGHTYQISRPAKQKEKLMNYERNKMS